VFVPRQETEVMTGWAIDALSEMDIAEPVVADLGTGSGAIALAIAQEVPRARVHAVEADPLARQWAERNVARCAAAAPHTAGRVTLHGDDFATALADLSGAVDLVISNPPYIPAGAWVPPEVGEYDPAARHRRRHRRALPHLAGYPRRALPDGAPRLPRGKGYRGAQHPYGGGGIQ